MTQWLFLVLSLYWTYLFFALNNQAPSHLPTDLPKTIEYIIDDDHLDFIVLGDFGEDSEAQRNVASAINEYSKQTRIDFVISTGDNLYHFGIQNNEDISR